MSRKELKRKVSAKIEENRAEIIKIVKEIYKNPETGYKEKKSAEIVKDAFRDLNLDVEEDIALTGVKATAKSKSVFPNIAVLGELDAVILREHPDADLTTGAVHACGHNNQIGIMLGVAYGVIKSKLLEELSGVINFMAVPAEEFIELEYRDDLITKGKLNYIGGKQELIKRGYFDEIDLAMLVHSYDVGEMKDVIVGPSGSGFIGKRISFKGQSSHAGDAPEKGVNALNAAVLAINNINAQRETFKDADKIRVHPIITKGGDVVNIVPGEVKMESYVRGKTVEAIFNANQKVNRAIQAGADAVGAEVEIKDIPGYLPLNNYPTLLKIFEKNLEGIVPKERVIKEKSFAGSFDMGDLSHIMPTLHPFFSGVKGSLHSKNFQTVDYDQAVIKPAKVVAKTIIDILIDKNTIFEKLKTPPYTKEKYLDILSNMKSS